MDEKEILEVFERAIDERLNEDKIKDILDIRLSEHLKAIPKNEVITGGGHDSLSPDNVTFSQFLGDVRRHAETPNAPPETVLRHLKPEQLVKADSGIDPSNLPPALKKDLAEGTNSAGGYLVPQERSNELLNLVSESFSVVPGLCRQVPMKRRQILFPTLTSGLQAYWVPETTDSVGVTESNDTSFQTAGGKRRSDVTFSQMAITAHVCAVKVVVSNQLLDDSDPIIDKVLYNLFAESLGAAWDMACLSGAGTILDPIAGLDTKISTNTLEAGDTFDFDDIIDLIFACTDQDSHANPVIVGTTKAEKKILKIKDSTGQYIYQHPTGNAKTPTVWGQPFHRNGNVSNTEGTGGTDTLLYSADFRRHAFAGKRMGIIIKTNPWAEPYFSHNQTAFLAEFRVGFNVDHEKHFAKLSGIPTT